MNTRIRQLTPADAEQLFALRREALLDAPFSFSASPQDDRASSVVAVREQLNRAPASVVFGAADEQLVGMLGIYRAGQIKAAHVAHIWGVFVQLQWRGRGIAAQLLDAAITYARTLEGVATIQLAVNETTPEAQRLYERFGFRVWGVEPDALRFDGKSTSESHMSLFL